MRMQAVPQSRAGCRRDGMSADPSHPRGDAVAARLAAFEEEVNAPLRPSAPACAVAQIATAADSFPQVMQKLVEQ